MAAGLNWMLFCYYKKLCGTETRTFRCLMLLASASVLAFYSSEDDALELLPGSWVFNLYYVNTTDKDKFLRAVWLFKE